MTYLVGTKAQVAIFRAAIDAAEGMPRRGVVHVDGKPAPDADRLPKVYAPGAPGWTETLCDDPIEGTAQAALELPPEAEKYLGQKLGKVTMPAKSASKDEASLPAELVVLVRARKGLDADGLPVDVVVKPKARIALDGKE